MEVIAAEESLNVRWSNHHRAICDLLEKLYTDESYVDCSLAADGEEISAHKLILSACSPFLNNVLKKHSGRHPIIVLKDVSFEDLKAVVEYIYKGEVSLPQDRLSSFLKAAQMLSVDGLFNPTNGKRPQSDSYPSKHITPESETSMMEEDGLSVAGEEYLSDDGNLIKATNGEFQLIIVGDDGSINENAYTEEGGSFEADFDNLITTSLSVEDPPEGLPTQLSKARSVRRQDYSVHCDKCGGLYKHEASYLNHLRHDCSQTHTCHACRKSFKNKRHLLDHVRDDCGRVHYCQYCKHAFRQKVNLTTHQKHYCKPKKTTNAEDIFILPS